jgi:hypothetical protein
MIVIAVQKKIYKTKYNRHGFNWENTSYLVEQGECMESGFCEEIIKVIPDPIILR